MSKKSLRFTLKALTDAGYIEHEPDKFIHSNRTAASIAKPKKSKGSRTGWIDDSRNMKCREKQDMFCQLVLQELNLIVWPEFYACPDREWRIDYAIPINPNSVELKIAIEVEGGIWTHGRHTRGKGFKNDMEKYNYLTAHGWKLIRVVPDELITNSTLELVKTHLFFR